MLRFLAFLCTVIAFTDGAMRDDTETRYKKCNESVKSTIYDFEVETLTGERKSLSEFRGKVLLIVNVATFCGYTEQYKDFNAIMERNPGVELLAFPCDQFHLQEPARNDEILNGLKYVRPGGNWTPGKQVHIFGQLQEPARNDEILNGLKYVRPGGNWTPGKQVHIFGKLEVNGEHEHPLYAFLKYTCPPTSDKIGNRDVLFWDPIKGSDVVWNFEKYLIDKRGRPRVRFFPGTWNNGKRVEEHFNELLNEKI
uniref:glutathione peroxidase n=1 Tax=Plectus sambesii TaxID=2011161 RepID=A0A914X442_9BILA